MQRLSSIFSTPGSTTHRNSVASRRDHWQGTSALIPLMNKLQDVFTKSGVTSGCLQLPRIVVVGTQSSGKSSVLESFVGKSFLPRGTGLVTRCPLILRLVHHADRNDSDYDDATSTASSDEPEEWCEFQHILGERKWTNFDEVRAEILRETERKTIGNYGITNNPITLTVYSPNVVTLTVVDLPGIVKNPIGDQPPDIENQILALIRNYIEDSNTIILAVTPASLDIAASESIKFAREVDPDGRRTLAVITKLDTVVPPGQEMLDVLAGNVVHVKYGIIGVANRTQAEILANKPLDQVRRDEKLFLQKYYPQMVSTHGTSYLAHRLSHLLMRQIFERLPGLESYIEEMIQQHKEDLDALGGDDIPEKSKTMSRIITRFSLKYREEFFPVSRGIERVTLCAGARIKYIFGHILGKDLLTVDPLENIADKEIQVAIQNAGAMEARTSIIESVYQDFVKYEIKRLWKPSLNCMTSVHEEIQQAVQCSLDPDICFQFPRLRESLVACSTRFLNERVKIVQETLRNYVDIQASYVITSDEMLPLLTGIIKTDIPKNIIKSGTIGWINKITKAIRDPITTVIETAEEVNLTDSGHGSTADLQNVEVRTSSADGRADLQSDCTIVKTLISMYFDKVRQNLQDFVIKLFVHSLIYYSVDNIQDILNEQLHTDEKIDNLIRVSDEAMRKRKDLQAVLQVTKNTVTAQDLHDSIKSINEIRETDLQF